MKYKFPSQNQNRYTVRLEDNIAAQLKERAMKDNQTEAVVLKTLVQQGLFRDAVLAGAEQKINEAVRRLDERHQAQLAEIQTALNQGILAVADQANRNEHFRGAVTRALEELARRVNPLINILEDRMNIPRDSTNSVPARTASADPYFNPDYPDWTPDNCPPPGDRRHYLWKTENVRRQKLANANK